MFGFAQTSGGQLRRPVKKQQTTGTTIHKKKENKKMVGNVSKRNGTKSRVLQNLIKKYCCPLKVEIHFLNMRSASCCYFSAIHFTIFKLSFSLSKCII